ncbi:metallophosphoesterase [Flavobacterium amniphilum]|uniref:T9SS type A sorting domain-containing protein n=1 Tax=Flavobacterium amniphilum TaxID=1834035 RepID=UPI00202AB97E|nr:metallophosphoesterase [Flavobacterium amniphilum]MCL9805813.1 metallophosphoesterase [Flavobacterium amniphilum]MCL9806400.1 metallophosphoesterase [Flavobacterium amniphilum]
MKRIYFLLLCMGMYSMSIGQTTLVSTGSSWKYLDNGTNQGTAWRATTINETSWKQGNAQLGYGDGDEATVVSYGTSTSNRYVTTYFRKTFSVTNPSQFLNYTLRVKRDDGVAVYVNGTEIYRNNLAASAGYTTLATLASDDGGTFQSATLPANTFVSGSNTIAVEIHQNAKNSSDISFDLELKGNTSAPPSVTQKHIRWGTTKNPLEGLTVSWTNSTAATTDQIKWGYTTTYEQGTSNVTSRSGYSSSTNKFFSFTFPGILTANATIYYSLFDSVSGVWSAQKTFTTTPPTTTDTFKFAAVGDSRTNVGVWNTISTLTNNRNPAFVVFNGDIVDTGSSASQWDAWFDNGTNLINNRLILHAQGNHDVASASYYQNIFDLPKNNTPQTELYYSVEYGETVFICLNSETPSDVTQYNWLKSTLAANASKKWKIISFHRPFYTVGPHAGEMDAYWNTWFKAFDDYGVDLILTGHDHLYERFKPINRNVSTSSPVANYGSQPTEGRCQVVCGGAGAPLYTAGSSSFLQAFKSDYHYVIFDVTGTTLCGTVYDDTNVVIDNFCINKPNSAKQAQKQIFYPIKVYPNPVKDSFKVEYSSPNTGEAIISIYDVKGNLITTEKTNKPATDFTYTYNGSTLKPGVYVFEIQMENQKDSSILVRE